MTVGYCGSTRGYCKVLQVLRVLWMNLGTAQYPRVLHGTVGTVGTARAKSDSWVLRQYPWVLQGTVGTVGTARVKSGSWVLWQYPWVLWVLWVLHG